MIKVSKRPKEILFVLFLCCIPLLINNCVEAQPSESINKDNTYAADYDKIRVLTYNIQHGNTTSGTIDLDMYGQIIKEQNPDIVALQEVDNGARRSGRTDQTTELAKRTELVGCFGKYRDYQGGEFGDAILSSACKKTHSVSKKTSRSRRVKSQKAQCTVCT